MNFRLRTLSRPLLASLILTNFLLVACNQPLSLQNYNKLQTGQTYDEVNQMVGPPARCDEMLGVRSCVWGDDQHGFSVNFIAGKVILLSAKGLK